MLDRWPNWLRWLLFLPVSVVASLLAYPIILILNELTVPSYMNRLPEYIFFRIIASMWSAVAFIWIGATIAPYHKLIISVILAVVYTFLLGCAFVMQLVLGDSASTSWLDVGIYVVVGVITSVIIVTHIYNEENRHEDELFDNY